MRAPPLLNAADEKRISEIKEFAYRQVQDAFLKHQEGWFLIYEHWQKIKIANRASNKLTEEYGNTNFDASELTIKIETNLTKAFTFINSGKVPNKKLVVSLLLKAGLSKRLYLELATKLLTKIEDKNLTSCLNTFFTYRDKLVNSNLRLVQNFAKDFPIQGVSIDDLVQEGNCGLVRAAEKFDPSRNLKFSTYAAFWIRQAFIGLVKTQSRTIRLPSHIHNNLTKIKKATEQFRFENNKDPNVKDVAALTGLEVATIQRMVSLKTDTVSLETYVGSPKTGRQKQLKDLLKDERSLEGGIVVESRREALLTLLETYLAPLEREVVQRKFGLDRKESSFKDICEDLHLKREKVKALFDKGLEKLKGNPEFLEAMKNE